MSRPSSKPHKSPEISPLQPVVEKQPPREQSMAGNEQPTESATGLPPEKWYELMNERGDLLAKLGAKNESWPPETETAATSPRSFDAASRIKRRLAKIDEQLRAINIGSSERSELSEFYQAVETDEKFQLMLTALERLKQAKDEATAQEYAIISESKSQPHGLVKADREALREIRQQQQEINQQDGFLAASAETAPFYRMAALEMYRQSLQTKNFVETPSRQALAERIKFHIENSEPVLLEGETGTGKTELALNLCRQLYGREPEFISGSPDVRASDLLVKQGLRASKTADREKREKLAQEISEHIERYKQQQPEASEMDIVRENDNYARIVAASAGITPETYYIYGPLVRAMEEGLPLVIDEANLIEPRLRLVLKRIYNAKPGDKIALAGDGQVKVAPGFALILTANLKSEKHTERFDFDEAEKRVMINSTIHVDYLPKAELYDLLLAKAMDNRGEAPLSRNELETTLKNFCDGIEAVQIAYCDKPSEAYAPKDARGKQQEFREGVLDPGAALRMLNGLEAKDPSQSLTDFLDRSLLNYVANRNYNPKDRELIAKIFMSKGFLQKVSAKQLEIPDLAEDTLKPFKTKSAKATKEPISAVRELNRRQLAELDPYGLRKIANQRIGEGFLSLAGSGGQPEADPIGEDLEYRPLIATKHYLVKEGQEQEKEITLDLEEILRKAEKFYRDHGIILSPDFETRTKDIWKRHYEAIRKEIARYGYDHLLIIPDALPGLEVLNSQMTKDYTATWQGENFQSGGSFAGAKNSRSKDNYFRLVLVHQADAQNLQDNPLLAATLNKSPEQLTGKTAAEIESIIDRQGDLPIDLQLADIAFGDNKNPSDSVLKAEGLTLSEYLIFQRQYFEATGRHLDEIGYSWLLSTFSAPRLVVANWGLGYRQLLVEATGVAFTAGRLGCRPSRSFR